MLATRGQRETEDGGQAPVPDEAEVEQLKCQAQRVHLHSLAFAALCTALMLIVGEF